MTMHRRSIRWRERLGGFGRWVRPAAASLLVGFAPSVAGAQADAIRLDQVGYAPDAPKVAYAITRAMGGFHVVTADGRDTVLSGRLGALRSTASSTESTRAADFSAVRDTGRFVVVIPGLGTSHPFRIAPRVHEDVARAALKAFYFQRASVDLDAAHAGPWARTGGHPDTAILVHPSAASADRPAGTRISSPGGWYDAGDYNKYVVNSGISTATLLAIHQDFPAYARTLETGIPESGDAVPDVLQEAWWNLRWMLTMQDPADGGVYHKLTEATFSAFVMPTEVRAPRYVVQKSTAAALNFAAVTAQASRVLRPYARAMGIDADSLLAASVRAWAWARRHPRVRYDQDALNRRTDPDILTGEYGDAGDYGDELAWAATELALATGQDSFFTAVRVVADSASIPSWGEVRTLAYYALVQPGIRLTPRMQAEAERARAALRKKADALAAAADGSAFGTPMGGARADYVWGSNAVAANQGVLLVNAYRATGDRRYLDAATANLEYLLGRNATGYSFVTGHGARTPMHPHHRLSAGDTVAAPVPGMLVGGPNPGRQDGCSYPHTEPDRAYVDDLCSYAANEIAINWNAPFAYLAAAVEAVGAQQDTP